VKKGSTEGVESFEKEVKSRSGRNERRISASSGKIFPCLRHQVSQPMDLQDSALRDDEWVVEYEVTEAVSAFTS